jgi:hypothetical protein
MSVTPGLQVDGFPGAFELASIGLEVFSLPQREF